MAKPALPFPVRVGLAILSITLTFGGVTGIASSFVIWHGFVADFLSVYYRAVAQPLAWIVDILLPTSWPRPPRWTYDLFVVWGFSLTTLRLFLLFEGETAILQRRAMRRWWAYPLVVLLGPIAPLYLIYAWLHLLVREHLSLSRERMDDYRGVSPLSRVGRIALQKREDAVVTISEELIRDIKKLLIYFAAMVALVILLLMINYQMSL